MKIKDFLLARIAEDAEAARRAAFGWGAKWESSSDDYGEWFYVNAEAKRGLIDGEDVDVVGHIARHDPARILAECASKREIIEAATSEPGSLSYLCPLAAVYSDHPDYQKEWEL